MIFDTAAIELLSGENTLRDSLLIEVVVREATGRANVELRFAARAGSVFSQVTLRLTEVVEFDFHYDKDYTSFDVWDLKFLQLKDGTYYIALDPDPATLPPACVTEIDASDADNFFVRAHHVEAVVTKSGESQPSEPEG
jgi:hypothetical protein